MIARIITIAAAMAAGVKAQQSTAMPSSFFAISGVGGNYPRVTVGFLAHQEFAWGTIEQSKGVFNFKNFDNYMASSAFQRSIANGVTPFPIPEQDTTMNGSSSPAGLLITVQY